MRDIEYRCWSHNSNSMQGWDELKEHGDFYRLLDMPDKYPLMQFTGLLDANGNKVFEGDLLGASHVEPREVIFEDGAFRFKDDSSNQCNQSLVPFTVGRLNVVGNIYQHPHLIKDEKS